MARKRNRPGKDLDTKEVPDAVTPDPATSADDTAAESAAPTPATEEVKTAFRAPAAGLPKSTPARTSSVKKDDAEDADKKDTADTTDALSKDTGSKETAEADSDDAEDVEDLADEEPEERPERSAETEAFWSALDIDPVEISLADGTGYTLRHYRKVTDEDGDEAEEALFLATDGKVHLFRTAEGLVEFIKSEENAPVDPPPAPVAADEDDEDDADVDEDADDKADDDTAESDDDDKDASDKDVKADADDDDSDEDESDEDIKAEAAPLTLADDEDTYPKGAHDLAAVADYKILVEKLVAADVIVDDEDLYELDLVVENLRGGHDAWDKDLLIGAGEVTRDLAFACRLNDVLSALSAGSPLDELDEALRARGLFARRRLRKISAERAAMAWRGLIGKLTAAVSWHD